ncbi:hypothetical protein [Azospirillum picis]|uniref:Stress-induced protein n=1 Tax=Azospirillum picis TaxID=488438 RepID=A0ABU0MMQ3_9PROT|nr:hypothetical protein [Azospirillum picis]MBP2300777.1 hypothetical protein [Azospirillum picis]MDQ0534746.1 hypothetical protein [Azospirillum picis]
MSDGKKNRNPDGIKPANQGDQQSAGTGAHATHAREAGAETADNKAKGKEAREAGYGKGNTRPEGSRN